MRSIRFPHALTLIVITVAACAQQDTTPQTSEAPATVAAIAAAPSLDAALSLGVPNAREPVPSLVTAGQVTPEQMQGLADAGYTNFISLRLASENGAGWEEAAAAEAGLSFTRLPITGADDLTREQVVALDHILDDAGDAATVLYCGSSNRVGALLALRAAWLDDMDAEQALEFGRSAGMTRLEPAVQKLLGM